MHANPSTNGAAKPSTNGHAAAPLNPDGDGSAGRDSQGRFAPGNRCSVGNPHHRRVAMLREAALATITPDDMRRIFSRWRDMAVEGDLAAGALLVKYVWGRAPCMDADSVDLDEWARIRSWPSRAEMMVAGIDTVTPADAVEAVKQTRSKKPNVIDADGVPTGEELVRERKRQEKRRR
jgi:hypothetical protein